MALNIFVNKCRFRRSIGTAKSFQLSGTMSFKLLVEAATKFPFIYYGFFNVYLTLGSLIEEELGFVLATNTLEIKKLIPRNSSPTIVRKN